MSVQLAPGDWRFMSRPFLICEGADSDRVIGGCGEQRCICLVDCLAVT